MRLQAAEKAVESISSESWVKELSGTVEYAPAGTNRWTVVGPSQKLAPGDRLRTQKESRAVIQLSDRSVVRIGPSTVVEIQPPQEAAALRRLRLIRGLLFFLNREKPSHIEFETPLTTGAIRGTEFSLTVGEVDGTTDLALLDGEVLLASGGESRSMKAGERVVVAPGAKPVVTSAPPARQLVQWALYYPVILDPASLVFEGNEATRLAASFAAYRTGDIRSGMAFLPGGFVPGSTSSKAYVAALRLAAGNFEEARRLVKEMDGAPFALALGELMDAITFEPRAASAEPQDASGWLARSFTEQSRGELKRALLSAKKATELAPGFGFAWSRVAELELGFGRREAALRALKYARESTPKHGAIPVLEGFMALERGKAREALELFDQAVVIDDSNGSAWLGRGLARVDLRDLVGAASDLQVAAVLEPQRSLLRSAQAKIRGQQGEAILAKKDFRMAQELDPSDPTPWLYQALLEHRENRINDAVYSLERSVDLNDGRRLYRSRLLLDQDRAVRNADLALIYADAGLNEVARHSAARAVEEDPLNPAAHLFLSRSYGEQESPDQFDLRNQTSRQSSLLVANLLAARGGGNLSQYLSQNPMQSFVGMKPLSLMSVSEYRSQGDWTETATVYGQVDGLGYALDGQYRWKNGDQPNGWMERSDISLQLKQELGPSDSVYFQISDRHMRAGDVARHEDPNDSIARFHVSERQEPNIYAGFHHEWSPESHTLLLASRLTDRLNSFEPGATLFFLRDQFGGPLLQVQTDQHSDVSLFSDYVLQSVELQQIWKTERFGLVVGGRFQSGDVENRGKVDRDPTGVLSDETQAGVLERSDLYGLFHWQVVESLRLTAGLAYERVKYPSNVDLPPLDEGQEDRSKVVPRAGLTWDLWKGAALRGSFSQSLGGLYFDDAVRLEPVQMAGFVQTYRSLAPESLVALVPGSEFQTLGVGLDQHLGTGTYFGVDVEELRSEGDRQVGVLFSPDGSPTPQPGSVAQLRQSVDFRERALVAYAAQLIGSRWSVGARYRLSEASLDTRLPSLPPGLVGLDSVEDRKRAVLGDLELFGRFYHECGFFAGWSTHWRHQSQRGFVPVHGAEDFWQHDVTVGYRFLQRRAEASVSVLNLTGRDYRLNPLNYMIDPPRERTVVVSLRLLF